VQEQPLEIIMDPRSLATRETLQEQLQLGQHMFTETLEARRALAEIGSVQKQLADIQQKLSEASPQLKSAAAEAQSEVERILGNKEAEAKTANPGLQEAYGELASALQVVEGGDRAVPSQAIAVYKESSQQIKMRIAQWVQFKQSNLTQLNQHLREKKIAPVTISEIEEEVEFLMSR
jgi:uncharacterized phage infection (PIP) family protein YhgE